MRSISNRLISHLSSSEREHALKNLGIGPAAHLIRDAVLGERSPENWFDPYADPDRPFSKCSVSVVLAANRSLVYESSIADHGMDSRRLVFYRASSMVRKQYRVRSGRES